MAKVLLVEDDIPLQELYAKALEIDHQVSVAASSAEAIKLIDNTHFDLIVMDLNLPDAPGTNILKHVQAQSEASRPRIVVMTGFSYQKMNLLPEEVAEVINKPVTSSMLLRVAASTLANPRRI